MLDHGLLGQRALVRGAPLLGIAAQQVGPAGAPCKLGVSPGRVALVIAIEAVFEAALAAVLAGVLGLLLAKALHDHPLDLSGLMPKSSTLGGMAFDPVIGAVILPL